MTIEALLSRLGEAIGLPELALDENKLCRMIFDGKWTIDLEYLPAEEMFFIYSPVCRVPQKNRDAFFTALLRANLFGKETGGFAHFGLDETSGEVLLFARFDIEKIAYDEFAAALEMFLDRVTFWTRQAGVLMDEPGPAEEGGNRNWALRV